MTEQPGAEWLTVAEAAAQLGVSERTIRRRCESGKLAAKRVAGEGGGIEWHISPDAVTDNDRAATRADGRTDRRSSNRVGTDNERSNGQTVNSDQATARPSERTEASGQTDTDLARIQGYLARDMELVIGRAVAEAVEAAQAPLLARIDELTQAVERLSESRQESPQTAPEAQTTIQPPEPLREAQGAAQGADAPFTRGQALRQLRQAVLKLMGWQ